MHPCFERCQCCNCLAVAVQLGSKSERAAVCGSVMAHQARAARSRDCAPHSPSLASWAVQAVLACRNMRHVWSRGQRAAGVGPGDVATCFTPFVQSPRPHTLSSPTTTDADEDASAIRVRFAREPSSHTQSHQGAGAGRRWPTPCGHSTGLHWTEDGERGGRIESGGWPEHAC